MTGAALLVAAAMPALGGDHGHQNRQKRVRIRPFPPHRNLRPGEMAFYRDARFKTAADAMRAVASRQLAAEIYMI